MRKPRSRPRPKSPGRYSHVPQASRSAWLEVNDKLWNRILAILDRFDPPKQGGRPKADRRRALEGIIFRLRTQCRWNHIPKAFGDDSTVHRYFHRWSQTGAFNAIWPLLLREYEALREIDWRARGVARTSTAPRSWPRGTTGAKRARSRPGNPRERTGAQSSR